MQVFCYIALMKEHSHVLFQKINFSSFYWKIRFLMKCYMLWWPFSNCFWCIKRVHCRNPPDTYSKLKCEEWTVIVKHLFFLSPTHPSPVVCLKVCVSLETAKESDHRLWLHNIFPRAPWAPVTNTHTLALLNPGNHSCKTRVLLCTHLPCWAVWAERQRERIGEGTGFRRPGRCLLILPWLPWQ